MFWQTAITAIALVALVLHPQSANKIRELWLPFVKNPAYVFPAEWWGYGGLFAMMFLWVVGFSNFINLTDGLDGLATGCTISVALVYGIMAYAAGHAPSPTTCSSVTCRAWRAHRRLRALIGASIAFPCQLLSGEIFMGHTVRSSLGGYRIMAFMVRPAAHAGHSRRRVRARPLCRIQVGYSRPPRPRRPSKRSSLMPDHPPLPKTGLAETKSWLASGSSRLSAHWPVWPP
jgi:phospho-N-acetylmuramoyl-pentapeptide-transferase